MVIHLAAASGGNGRQRTSACKPIGAVIGGRIGARFYCVTDESKVTCKSCLDRIQSVALAYPKRSV